MRYLLLILFFCSCYNPIDNYVERSEPVTLPPCVEHPHASRITAQTSFGLANNYLYGEYNFVFIDGTEWQQNVVIHSIEFINQFQTKTKLNVRSHNPDAKTIYASFNDEGCYSMVGLWAFQLQEGISAINFAGVKEEYLGTHNEGYIRYCTVHELIHLLGYVHVQDLEQENYQSQPNKKLRPWNDCSIMMYQSKRKGDGSNCPHQYNWVMDNFDRKYIWEDFGKPDNPVIDINNFILEDKPNFPPEEYVDPCDDEAFLSTYKDYVEAKQMYLGEYEKYRTEIERVNLIMKNL